MSVLPIPYRRKHGDDKQKDVEAVPRVPEGYFKVAGVAGELTPRQRDVLRHTLPRSYAPPGRAVTVDTVSRADIRKYMFERLYTWSTCVYGLSPLVAEGLQTRPIRNRCRIVFPSLSRWR